MELTLEIIKEAGKKVHERRERPRAARAGALLGGVASGAGALVAGRKFEKWIKTPHGFRNLPEKMQKMYKYKKGAGPLLVAGLGAYGGARQGARLLGGKLKEKK